MSVLAVIPARYASVRFPGKPLARRTGKYLVQHVYEQVVQAHRVDACIVATDDDRILQAVHEFGGRAELTRSDHVSGTDRVAEVARRATAADGDIILNVQGDEPEIEPAALDRLVARLVAESEADCPMATLACAFPADWDPADANAVKVVLNSGQRALYFSRARIPYPRDDAGRGRASCLLHIGVYAYRRKFLLELAELPPGRLEQIEKLEQLRVLERGAAIAVELVDRPSVGVDTPQDYDRFVARWFGGEGEASAGRPRDVADRPERSGS